MQDLKQQEKSIFTLKHFDLKWVFPLRTIINKHD